MVCRCAALQTLYTAGHKVELAVGLSADPGLMNLGRWALFFFSGHEAGPWIPGLPGMVRAKRSTRYDMSHDMSHDMT